MVVCTWMVVLRLAVVVVDSVVVGSAVVVGDAVVVVAVHPVNEKFPPFDPHVTVGVVALAVPL